MSRPTVPHCKECKFLRDFSSSDCLHRRWYCTYGVTAYPLRSSRISGQEVRSCPRWCPLRLAGYVRAY